MEAPMHPLSEEQVKELASAVLARRSEGWQPNEVYMTVEDSGTLWGEVSVLALDALVEAEQRAAEASRRLEEAERAITWAHDELSARNGDTVCAWQHLESFLARVSSEGVSSGATSERNE